MTKCPARQHSIRCRTETDMLHLDDIKHTKFRPRSKAARYHSNNFAGNPKIRCLNSSPADRAASAYNHVGDNYSRYADGDARTDQSSLSAYRFAHADTIVWKALQAALDELRQSGITDARVLDAGCGPGLWSKRIADYSRQIGLCVSVVGFDISITQLEIARQEGRRYLGSFIKRRQADA
jgi:SAM-dependent methyltransferase